MPWTTQNKFNGWHINVTFGKIRNLCEIRTANHEKTFTVYEIECNQIIAWVKKQVKVRKRLIKLFSCK